MQFGKELDRQPNKSGSASPKAVESHGHEASSNEIKIQSRNKCLCPAPTAADVYNKSTSTMPLKDPQPERRREDPPGKGEVRRHRSFQSSLRHRDAHDHGPGEEPGPGSCHRRASSHFVSLGHDNREGTDGCRHQGQGRHRRDVLHRSSHHSGDRHERREGRRSNLNSEAERRRREQRAREDRGRRFSRSAADFDSDALHHDSDWRRPRGQSLSQSESKGLDYNPRREHRRRSVDGKRDIHDKVHNILDQITRVKADFESSSRSCNDHNDSMRKCLASLDSIYKSNNHGKQKDVSEFQKKQFHGTTLADGDSSSFSTPPTATSFTDSSNLSTATVGEECEEQSPVKNSKEGNEDEYDNNVAANGNENRESTDNANDGDGVDDVDDDDESLGSLLRVTGQDQVIEIKDFDPSLVADSTSTSNATKTSEEAQQRGVPRVILSTNCNHSSSTGETSASSQGAKNEIKNIQMNSSSNLNHTLPKYKPPPKHPTTQSPYNAGLGAVAEGSSCQVTEENKNLNLNWNSFSSFKPPPPKRVPPPPPATSLPTKSTESFTTEAGIAGSAGSTCSVNATAETVSTDSSVTDLPPPPKPRFSSPPPKPTVSLPQKSNESFASGAATHDRCRRTVIEENKSTHSAPQSPVGMKGISEFSSFLKKSEQDYLQQLQQKQQHIHNPPTTPKSPAKPRMATSFNGMPLPPPKTTTTPVTPKKKFEFQPPVRRSRSQPTDNSSVASGCSSVFGGNIPPPPPLARGKSQQQTNSVPPPPPPPLPRRPIDQNENPAADQQKITTNSNQTPLKSILRKNSHAPPPSSTSSNLSVTSSDFDTESQPTSKDAPTPSNSESGSAPPDSTQPIQLESSSIEEQKATKLHHTNKLGLKSVLKKFLHPKKNDSKGVDNKNNVKNTSDKNFTTQKSSNPKADTISISSSSSSAMPATGNAEPKPASKVTSHTSPPTQPKPTVETEHKPKLINPNNRRPKHVFEMPFTDQFGDFGFYTGEVDEDVRPHGHGKMKYENGVFYEGKWKNGNQDSSAGLQRERMLSGFTSWSGVQKKDGSKDGIRHVYGMSWIDNAGMSGKYFGKVNDKNLPHGMGKMVYDMGLTAEGEWVEGNLAGAAPNGSMMGAASTVVPGGSVIGGGMSILGGGGMSVMGSGGMSVFQGMPVFCGFAMGPMPYQHQSQGKPFKPMMNSLPEEVPCSISVANDDSKKIDVEQPQKKCQEEREQMQQKKEQQHQEQQKHHLQPSEQPKQQHRPQHHDHRQQHPKPQQQSQEQRKQHHKQQQHSRSNSPDNINQPHTEKTPSISIVGGPLFEEMKMKEQEETFKKNAPSESVTGSIIFC